VSGAARRLGTAADCQDARALGTGGGVELIVVVAGGGGAGFLEKGFEGGDVGGDDADIELEEAPELDPGVAVGRVLGS
jgi:hypothetical protein